MAGNTTPRPFHWYCLIIRPASCSHIQHANITYIFKPGLKIRRNPDYHGLLQILLQWAFNIVLHISFSVVQIIVI